ncbi:MAG: ABC transporter ATP-binding protein [Anaerolineales bacterium]|nr:ABC transporter ATP-binding protein [Anaerolineales bacterium]
MIVTQDLSKQFGDYWAVNKVNLNIQQGEVLALLGPNGAGKTTTIRILTSVLRPTKGRAWIAGYDVVKEPKKVRAAVGVLTEQHGLYGRMPAIDYLDFFGQLYGLTTEERKARTERLLDEFSLGDDSDRRIEEYSKGMRQKLALARALLHDPPVLLLDEPTSAMDPESAHLVRDAIRDLRSASRAIIICTHNLSEAEELADKIAVIRQGEIIVQGSPDDLKSKMLGPAEYEVRLASQLNGQEPKLPAGAVLTSEGLDWLRYQTTNPNEVNPELLQLLLEQGFPVVGLREVPRSLEQVYMQAIYGYQESVSFK